MKYDVFISYSRKDSEIVKKFADELGKAGYSVWMDKDGIRIGDQFKEKIVSAIEEARTFLFFSSVASNASSWVIKEMNVAVELKKPIIPVKLDASVYNKSILLELAGVNFVQHNSDSELSSTIQNLIHSLHSKIDSSDSMAPNASGVVEDVADICQRADEEAKCVPIVGACKTVPCKTAETRGIINGHEYVDLGLPSGLKWATCNVGANYSGDNGDYYAWGELSTKGNYDAESCPTNGKEMGDITGNPTYDVACNKWGATWRLPTEAEFKELIDNCKWKWTSQGSCSGYKVTSKINGNSIFLPAAGWRHDMLLSGCGEYGSYWSATPYGSLADRAYHFAFYKGYRVIDRNYRVNGRSVRPVSK